MRIVICLLSSGHASKETYYLTGIKQCGSLLQIIGQELTIWFSDEITQVASN
jgi:hypothetical protein